MKTKMYVPILLQSRKTTRPQAVVSQINESARASRGSEMCSRSNSIALRRRGAAPLLNSVSSTALTVFSLGLALGVVLPREAFAGSGVLGPVQTSIYVLGASNPITFGAATKINSSSFAGVYGSSSKIWSVANYGSIQGRGVGIDLTSSGSTVTNWGAISGTANGRGVLLPNGGSVTNQSGGSISGYGGVDIEGSGVVTNAGSISGGATAVFVASGSLNNESGGTLSMTSVGLSSVTAYVGGGGSIINAGKVTNAGYNTGAVVIGDGGKVTNSGTISTTGALDSAIYTLNGGSVTNSGKLTVSGANSGGVIFVNGGDLTNTGTINATGNGSAGVWLFKGGTVVNSSTISATDASGIGVGSNTAATVNNQSGGTITGAGAGVLISSGTGSVTNAGQIHGATASAFAVLLQGGGAVTNTGTLGGGRLGVYINGGSAASNSVTNSGSIYGLGTDGIGVSLGSGGTANNASGGTISGVADGVSLTGGVSSVINSGHIYGTAASGNGVALNAGGSMSNNGTISGGGIGVLYWRGRRNGDEFRRDHGDKCRRPRLRRRRQRGQPERRDDQRSQLRRRCRRRKRGDKPGDERRDTHRHGAKWRGGQTGVGRHHKESERRDDPRCCAGRLPWGRDEHVEQCRGCLWRGRHGKWGRLERRRHGDQYRED